MSRTRPFYSFNSHGLSLIELIITVTTLATLVALATPSLTTLMLRNEQTTAANSFLNHFYFARSLAVQKEKHLIICPSEDGKSCIENGNWSRGLIVYEDRKRNGILDPDDPVHGQYILPKNSKISIHSSKARTKVVYHGDGRPSGYNLTLTFCDPEERIEPKALIVNNVGRIRISDHGPGDSPLQCEH